MLLKIAWRNIWRSRTRSLVVIGSIVIGVWAVIALISFSSGMVTTFINNSIKNELSHIQIHDAGFLKERGVKFSIDENASLFEKIKNDPNVLAVSQRTVNTGMISSAKGARGLMIVGVDPETEDELTGLSDNIKEGDYFNPKKRNPILISKKMAEKLQVKVRQKVVLTFQNKENDISTGAFRIAGFFSTGNTNFDQFRVYTRRSDINRLMGEENIAHQMAVSLKDPKTLLASQSTIQEMNPSLSVQTYKEVSPEINLFESQIAISAGIFTFIVMLALIFGIINTMLMAVLERYRELGMLMSVGMKKGQIFFMIMLETIMLGMVAAPFGLLFGYATVKWLSKRGIDLSAYSDGLQQFGMSEKIYPDLSPEYYGMLAVAVAITSILASIYPALKAIRLKPVEAIRQL